MFAPIGLFLLVARIRLVDDHVTWHGVFRRGSFPIQAVDKILTHSTVSAFGPSEPVLDIRDCNKHRLLRVRTVYWSDQSIATLREFLARRFYS